MSDNDQRISGLVAPSTFKQIADLIQKVQEADEAMTKAIVTASEYQKILQNSKGLTNLQINYKNATIESEKFRKAQADASAAVEKLAQLKAKGVADFEKQVQKEVELQNKRIAGEEKKAKATAASAKVTETSRERERLAEIKLDQDRKKAFDRYEANLKRKAAADARDSAQEQRHNAIIEENSRAYRKLSTELDTARRKAQDIGVTFGVSSNEFKNASREVNELNTRINAVDSSLGINRGNLNSYSGALGSLTTMVSGLAAGFLSATALISSAFTTALKTDAIKTSLEFTFGGVDVAKKKMDDLRKTANRLGLEYTSLADAYRSFAGAAIASNFPIKETDRIFNAVANAGAKLKLTSDQVTGALTALQQMISKGTVQSEELRGQLGERLPGAFAIAARAMGVTQQELGKLLKDGKVLASDLLPKLADELDKTFNNDQTEQVTSLQGSVNELKNAFTEIVETKGALSGFFTFVVDRAGGAVRAISKLSEATGIFYDLATHPKKFVADSAKSSRDAAIQVLTDEARGAASDTAQDAGGKTQLFDRINTEAMLLKVLNSTYKELAATYNKIKPGDRTLTDTKRLQDSNTSLQYQIQFVRGLRDEYQKLYSSKGIKEMADADLTSIKAIQARITELKKLNGSAIVGNEIYERIAALQLRLKKPKATNDNSIKDELELNKKNIQGAKEAAERITEDETIELSVRIGAVKSYYEKTREYLLEDQKIQLKQKGLTKTQILTIEKDTSNKLAELEGDASKMRTAIIKSGLTKDEQARVIVAQAELNDIKKDEAFRLDLARRAFDNGSISEKQLGELTLKIQREYHLKYLQKEIEQANKLLKISTLTAKQRADAEKQLADLTVMFSQESNEGIVKSNASSNAETIKSGAIEIEKEREKLEQKKEIARELFNFTTSLVDATFTNRLNAIQAEIDANEIKKDKDLENLENESNARKAQVTSQITDSKERAVAISQIDEDAANQTLIINARAAAQQDVLEQKIRQEKVKQARADKAANVAEAIMNAALAMTKVSAQTGILTFAFSPLIAALTAAQIATILATPIPTYFKGTDNSKEGPALTDEKGAELYIPREGKPFIGSDKPNIKNLKAGTKIIPHHDLIRMMARPDALITTDKGDTDLSLLIAEQKQTNKLLKNIKPAPRSVITPKAWFTSQRDMDALNVYLKRNLGR